MSNGRTLARRRPLLEVCGSFAAAIGLAGCLGDDDGNGDDGEADGDPSADNGSGDDGGSGHDGGTDGGSGADGDTDDLDLQEANVVDVVFEESAGTYTFDVTLHHDDEREEAYANWWQVERIDGSQIARRDLTHAHSNQPFTRSETMEIADDVDCVVVRGHDQTHGYGGVAMLVSLASGDLDAVDQGSERQGFDAADCP